MSTKIFFAYRIPKKEDILKKLKTLKEKARETVANKSALLALIHVHVIDDAKKEYEKNPKNVIAKYALDENEKGCFDDFWAERVLEKEAKSLSKSLVDIQFECSVFYDDDYWYVKFFINNGIFGHVLEKIKDLGFEDYHYQNQTDIPNDISSEDYEERGEKWDKLLESSDGNYRDGFQYIIFDPYEFRMLLQQNYYKGLTGDKLYEHLSYNFNQKLEIKTE